MASVVTHQAAGLASRRSASSTPRFESRSRPLAIVSGKGGVGKSALAVNLAIGAARAGARTLLIDADAGLANADLLLGLIPRFDLDDWLARRCAAEELLCEGPHGLSLLVSGATAESSEALLGVLEGGGDATLQALIGEYDVVIVDLGAGVGDAVVDLATACGRAWLVTTPEPTSLADGYAMAKRLSERSPGAILELVVNRIQEKGSGTRTHQALERLCQRFLGRSIGLRGLIPEDTAILRSVALQSPFALESGRSEAARRVELLSESLIEEARSDRLQV